jgi:sugar phosphate isomerase/epimerase
MKWLLSGFCDEAGMDLGVQLDAARRAGLQMMDLRMIGGRNIADIPVEEAASISAKIRASGLQVGCLGSAIGKVDIVDDFTIDQQRLERVAGHAEALNCRSIRVFSYFNKSAQANWGSLAIERLEYLLRRAKELGLTLLMENERYLYGDRLPQVLELLEATGAGLIFDFDNFHQSGDDPLANWKALKRHVKAFHLKDSNHECVHVPFGTGAGRAREILSDALHSQWEGLLSLEPHLARSAAVMATGPHGRGSEEGNDPFEAFLLGAEAGKHFLSSLGATWQ